MLAHLKTNHFEAFYTMDWGHENPLKIYFTAVYSNYQNNGPKLFSSRGLNVYFLKLFADQSSVAHSIQLCSNINLFKLSKEYMQSHVFQFYQVASPGDVTAPSKTKVNFAMCKCFEDQLQKMK